MNKFRKIIHICFFLPTILFGQKETNIWHFGYDTLLSPKNYLSEINFNTIPTSFIKSGDSSYGKSVFHKFNRYPAASICDSLGNLIFYTDGVNTFNQKHKNIKNGDSLFGISYYRYLTNNSTIIIKKPLSNRYFYVFNTNNRLNYNSFANYQTSLNYSLLDMKANNGEGEVIQKNISLNDSIFGSIVAVKHKNNKDIWLAGIQKNSDTLILYKINNAGFQKSKHKIDLPYNWYLNEASWKLRFSNDGKYLAIQNYLYDFDNQAGTISNMRRLKYNPLSNWYISGDIEFSPNNKLMYFSCGDGIYQCPIKKIKTDDYFDSVCEKLNDYYPNASGDMQLGNNGKIYLHNTYLSSINNPDSIGSKIDITTNLLSNMEIPITESDFWNFFPNFVQSSIYQAYLRSENDCFGDSTQIILQNSVADSILWDLGDGKTFYAKQNKFKKVFADSGFYHIKAIAFNANTIDTFSYKLHIQKIRIPYFAKDTLVCTNSVVSLNVFDAATEHYYWNGIEKDSVFKIYSAGKYVLKTTNKACELSDSINIKYADCGFLVKNLCYDEVATFILNSKNADSVRWDFGDGSTYSTKNLYVNTNHNYADSGKYWVKLKTYKYDLFLLDSQLITIYRPIPPLLGNDTILCENEKIILQYNPVLYPNYEWNDGSKNPTFTVNSSGKYSLTVEDKGCKSTTFLNVKMIDCNITSQNFCFGDSTFFEVKNKDIDSVFWDFDDGNSQKTIEKTTKHFYQNGGNYSAKIKLFWNKLFKEINHNISITKLPEITFDRDSVCEEGFVTAQINEPNIQYFWSNGSTQKSIQILESGNYKLTIQKNGCEISDSIDIKMIDCICHIYVPNAFTPNNNGLNEGFAPIMDCQPAEYYMSIHNRWGQVIFETTDINQTWDGTYKNAICPDGIYIYMARIKYSVNGGNIYKIANLSGVVNLLR